MPKFQVEHASKLPPTLAFEKLDQFINQTDEMAKIDSSAKWQSDSKNLKGTLKGKQFSAVVEVFPHGEGSKVALEIEIGLLLTPLKGKITEILKSKLNKYLA